MAPESPGVAQSLVLSVEPVPVPDDERHPVERVYRALTEKLFFLSGVLLILLVPPIAFDIFARSFLGFSVDGMMEVETLTLVASVFLAVGLVTARQEHIDVDLLFNTFSAGNRDRLRAFIRLISFVSAFIFACITFRSGYAWHELTLRLQIPEKYFMLLVSFGFFTIAVGMGFDLWRDVRKLLEKRDWMGLACAVAAVALLCCLPFLYKATGVRLSGMSIGIAGFCLLFVLILLRVPIGLAMAFIAVIGVIALKRNPLTAVQGLSEIPFRSVNDFVFVAIPMFMLMGELASCSGLSKSLFACANNWLGRLPGGLAVATVGGCAGFGAVCGDSLPTVITMSSVALPEMRQRKYSMRLATGALAAGGTLGILIPPSMGFIFYSLMTEESIGKLFIAGIIPGLLLSGIFMAIIVFQVWRRPELAPPTPRVPWREKILSILGLAPIIALFVVVVGGILAGAFTPGEGGAVGALGAFVYAVARRTMSLGDFKGAMLATARMTGKVFALLVGVYAFGAFLAVSHLPRLMAEAVTAAGINSYVLLALVIVLYVFLGCVMNIVPMMLLTLPSLWPSIQAMGIDGVWFGVITVIVMEMGMITPPIGLNVFAMSSIASDVPMAETFRGIMPFFLGMIFCVLLIIVFPPIATWLPGQLF